MQNSNQNFFRLKSINTLRGGWLVGWCDVINELKKKFFFVLLDHQQANQTTTTANITNLKNVDNHQHRHRHHQQQQLSSSSSSSLCHYLIIIIQDTYTLVEIFYFFSLILKIIFPFINRVCLV